MRIRDDDLSAIWREGSPDVPSDRAGCLTDTEWARLLSKDADDAERLRAADHIASCVACADEYRLLNPLQSWAADMERVLSPRQPAAASRTGWRGWTSWVWSPRLALAAAAATLLLATQGVTLFQLAESRRENAQNLTQLTARDTTLSTMQTSLAAAQQELQRTRAAQAELDVLRQRVTELSTPQLDIGIVDLEPRYSGVMRGASDPQILTTAPNGPVMALILNLPALASDSTIEVELLDLSGQVRWTGRTERRAGSAALTLALPGGYPAGEYTVRLFDVTRGRRSLAEYPIVIRHTADGK